MVTTESKILTCPRCGKEMREASLGLWCTCGVYIAKFDGVW